MLAHPRSNLEYGDLSAALELSITESDQKCRSSSGAAAGSFAKAATSRSHSKLLRSKTPERCFSGSSPKSSGLMFSGAGTVISGALEECSDVEPLTLETGRTMRRIELRIFDRSQAQTWDERLGLQLSQLLMAPFPFAEATGTRKSRALRMPRPSDD